MGVSALRLLLVAALALLPLAAQEAEPGEPLRVRARRPPPLVEAPEPEYPPRAREARIRGVVRFTVLIGTDGAVQGLRFLSGHPLLAPAATEAVRQWRFRVTEIGGKPVEVITQIQVRFPPRGPASDEPVPL